MTSILPGSGHFLCEISGRVGHDGRVHRCSTLAPAAAVLAEFVRLKDCKKEKALARGEHCVKGNEHLEDTGEAGVGNLAHEVDPSDSNSNGGEHGGGKGGE